MFLAVTFLVVFLFWVLVPYTDSRLRFARFHRLAYFGIYLSGFWLSVGFTYLIDGLSWFFVGAWHWFKYNNFFDFFTVDFVWWVILLGIPAMVFFAWVLLTGLWP